MARWHSVALKMKRNRILLGRKNFSRRMFGFLQIFFSQLSIATAYQLPIFKIFEKSFHRNLNCFLNVFRKKII